MGSRQGPFFIFSVPWAVAWAGWLISNYLLNELNKEQGNTWGRGRCRSDTLKNPKDCHKSNCKLKFWNFLLKPVVILFECIILTSSFHLFPTLFILGQGLWILRTSTRWNPWHKLLTKVLFVFHLTFVNRSECDMHRAKHSECDQFQ